VLLDHRHLAVERFSNRTRSNTGAERVAERNAWRIALACIDQAVPGSPNDEMGRLPHVRPLMDWERCRLDSFVEVDDDSLKNACKSGASSSANEVLLNVKDAAERTRMMLAIRPISPRTKSNGEVSTQILFGAPDLFFLSFKRS
jgi:hypothetical protein